MPFFERLVGRFYDGVAADPVLRPLYPEADLAAATRRLTLFLAQYWGGPTTYDDERGHPRLRMRHAPFAIGPRRARSLARPHARRDRRPAPPADIAAELDALHRHGRRGDAQPRLSLSRPAPVGRAPVHWWPAGGATRRADRRWRRRPRRSPSGTEATTAPATPAAGSGPRQDRPRRGANAGHRVLAPDDAEVEAYLETALNAPAPDRRPDDRPAGRDAATGHRRRARLRQPVRPADRAPRPRAERLLRAAAARHAVGRDRAPRRPRRSSCPAARTRSTTTGAPSPTRRSGRGRIPVLGICYGAQLMAHELGGDVLPATQREYGPANVTITDDGRPVRRPRARAAGLDEPRRLDHPAARTASARPPRPTPRRSPASSTRSRASTASSSTPRSSTRRAAGTSCATSWSGSPARRRPGRRPTSSRRRSPRSASGSTPMPATTGSDGLVICALSGGVDSAVAAALVHRAVGRPADLHLRRPRADAQARVGAAARRRSSATSGCAWSWSTRASGSSRRLAGVEDPEEKRQIIGDEFIRVFEEEAREARPDRLPDPGHALPRRHRDRRPRRRRPPRRSRPTTTSAACRPTCGSS